MPDQYLTREGSVADILDGKDRNNKAYEIIKFSLCHHVITNFAN